MNRTSMYYGWKPDLPDQRDHVFSAQAATLKKLPAKIDLRSNCPDVYDQGQLGSCTANAIAGAFQFDLMKQKAYSFIPSRLFIYYNERAIENTVKNDSGAFIRDGIKSVASDGVCPETMWPYEINEFSQKPFAVCYIDALKHQAVSYQSIPRDLGQMKGCLADGNPFIIGFTVYESFESDKVKKTGVLNLPGLHERPVNGHAVLVVGYDDDSQRFIVRNSWGKGWGMKGYFTMPYDYLLNPGLSDDFWTIKTVTANPPLKQTITAEKAIGAAAADSAQSFTVTLDVTFSTVNPGDSKMIASHNGIRQTVTQSNSSISFDNVNSNERIQIDGKSEGETTVEISVDADPSQFKFPPGHFNDNFLIN